MRTSTRWFSALIALLLPVLFAGCDEPAPSGPSTAPAQVTVDLTDAPGDVAHARVDIGEIALQGDSTVVLFDEGHDLIDLTTLVGTTKELVAQAPVPAGTYPQLRVLLDGAVLETEDGDVFTMGDAQHPDGKASTGTLLCPSCGQTGLTVNFEQDAIELQEGAAHVLSLDFDVQQSFGREAGASDRWVMDPVIHGAEADITGSVTGTVSLDDAQLAGVPDCGGRARSVADFVPTFTDPNDTVETHSAVVDRSGDYTAQFLPPTAYDVGYADTITYEAERLVWSANPSTARVDVPDGGQTTADYTVTDVTCEAR